MRAATLLWLAAALLLGACAATPPLSGSRPGTATAAPAPAAPPRVEPASVPAGAPAVTGRAAPPAPSAAYQPTNDRIALVLPLQSTAYGRAAEAVRAGFMAAANVSGNGARIQVFAHGDDGVLDAITAAGDAGVALVVGPLTRDDVKTVLVTAPLHPRMLALNQLEDNARLPDDAYAFGLAVEADAVLLAQRAHDDGVRTIVAVISDAQFQQRFANAFLAEWEREGGAPARIFRFNPNPEVLAVMRREIGAQPPDAILLAVGGDEASLAKSFLPPGPVYASSQITDGLPLPMLRDLEGVRFVEIPWIADPSAPAFARLPRPDSNDAVVNRLYALGLDAFTLGDLLSNAIPPQRIEFEGATGHLSLTPSHSFARQGRLMIMHDGQSVPYVSAQ